MPIEWSFTIKTDNFKSSTVYISAYTSVQTILLQEPLLDLVTVMQEEQRLHKQNSRTEAGAETAC